MHKQRAPNNQITQPYEDSDGTVDLVVDDMSNLTGDNGNAAIYDNSGTAFKKVTPDNLGITGSGGGTDTLQRSLRTLGLVEVDAS